LSQIDHNKKLSINERVVSALNNKKPDRHPFISRLDVWFDCHSRAGTFPKEYQGLSKTQIHRSIGMGQEKYIVPFRLKLRDVELIAKLNENIIFHEMEPTIQFFCGLFEFLDLESPGITIAELITPVGKISAKYELLAENVITGTEHYIKETFIKNKEDYRVVEYIIERAEFVPRYDYVKQEENAIGDIGFVVSMVPRIPFQQIMLEYLGEIPLFYALHDNLQLVERLLEVLDIQFVEILHKLDELDVLYIESPDNIHGLITNPKLFESFCLPYYQRYTHILHKQGKKMGSHTDGNIKPLLNYLAESGLDVCESFSPFPLTECTFEEAWNAWSKGPIIWGGIPSLILDEETPNKKFKQYIQELVNMVGDKPIIFGVSDLIMGQNKIDRVKYIAEYIENFHL